jgi:hypothetical protein
MFETARPTRQWRLESSQILRGPRRPILTALRKTKNLHDVERAGESEWTPWIAILGLILFLAAIGSLMLGLAEAAAYLIA